MSLKIYRNTFAQCAVACVLAVAAISSSAIAGTINHGTFMGPGVAYLDVTETSSDPVPLYGTPEVSGDSIHFFDNSPAKPNPSLGFEATAGGGTVDITDGFLSMMIQAKPAAGAISFIEFSEGGDYFIDGLGSALARVSARLNVFQLEILEVDNSPIDPIILSGSDTFTQDISGTPPDGGNWDLSVGFNLNQALSNAGESFVNGATLLRVSINNTLTALTQAGSVANIVKKDFEVTPDTPLDPFVPEPTTLAMAGFGLAAALLRRKA